MPFLFESQSCCCLRKRPCNLMGESVTGRNAGVTAVLKNPTEKLSWVLTSMWRLPVLEASAWLKTEPAFSAGQNCGVSPVLRGS